MSDTVRPFVVYQTTNQNRILYLGWEGLDGDDTGLPSEMPNNSDKTVHVYGSFGGATVTLEGSNDPRANPEHADHANASWLGLTNILGEPISLTEAGIALVSENPVWVRPKSAGGTGADIDVAICGRE